MYAQTTLYRSLKNGNWSAAGSWQSSTNGGSTWVVATAFPTSANALNINIRNGHTIIHNTNVSVKGLSVDVGGTLQTTGNFTLTIADGDGTDCIVKGTFLRSSGSVSVGTNATIAFEKGGRYVHNRNADKIPLAVWDKESILEFRQFISNPLQFDQDFGKIEFSGNISGFSEDVTLEGDVYFGNQNFCFNTANNKSRTIIVKGNLTCVGNANLSAVQNNGSTTLEVAGDMDLNTGKFSGTNSNSGALTLKVNGNFNGKEFIGAQNDAELNMEVGGNFTVTEKFTGLSGNGAGNILVKGHFNGGKTFVGTQNNGSLNFEVKGNLYGGENMTFTNGNSLLGVTVKVGGDWYCAKTSIASQNNAPVNIEVKGNVYSATTKFTGTNGNATFTMLVNGNLLHTAGDFEMAPNQGNVTVTVLKDFTFSGSRFLFTSSNKTPVLNVEGNMSVTAGKFEAINGAGEINLNGNGHMQVFTSGTSYGGELNFNVRSGAYVQMNDAGTFVGGTGDFTLEATASLGIRAAAGITTSGSTCHIRVTGSRNYNAGSTYIYNGSITQVTGNGLVQGKQVHIDNTAGVTTTQNIGVSEKLWLNNGLLNTTASKLVTITNRSNEAIEGGGASTFINGPVLWYVQNTDKIYSIPIGKVVIGQPFFRYCRLAEVSGNGGFMAEYFAAIPPGRVNGKHYSLFQDLLTGILENEYWQIDRQEALGNPEARIVLPYIPSLIIKKWLGVDGTSISPASGSNVAIVKGVNDNSVWNFAYDPNFIKPFNNVNDAALSLPYQQDGELISGMVNSFSPFTFGFGYFKTLPVVLKSFQAVLRQQQVVLQWEIADSKDLLRFEIEHSTDGRNFTKIGQVIPQVSLAFDFVHLQPASGANYYRLAMVEKDGRQSYSRTELLQKGQSQTIIQGLLQNPMHGQEAVVLMQSAKKQRVDITVIDLSGKVIARQKKQVAAGAVRLMVSIPGLTQGYFRLLIQTEDGISKEIPFIHL